jgi:hypothetical protein
VTRRRPFGRATWPSLAIGVLTVLTVVLAQQPAGATFVAQTMDTGNSVSSAASFCTAPGTAAPINPEGDSWTNESAVDDTHQNDLGLHLRSYSGANYRTWIRFVLPTPPHNCALTNAVLKVYDNTPSSSTRTIDVYRGDPTAARWTSAAISWRNQPSGVGTPVGAPTPTGAGWQQWSVADHVNSQYTDGNNGFLLQDHTENSGTAREQVYYDLQDSTYPSQLILTWG